MRKIPIVKVLIPALLAVFVALILAETLVVKVKTTTIKKEPVFYSSVVATLTAGEQVEKLAEKSGWIQVKTAKGQVGWVHSSALQSRKFVLAALNQPAKTGAAADEVALAGKGFNKQVEDKYKTNHPDISFAEVDRMLGIKVSSRRLREFLEKGKLGDFGGGE